MSAALESQAKAMFPFQGSDHLAWCKRIIWRLERGDKTLSMVQIQFAKIAMGITDTKAAA